MTRAYAYVAHVVLVIAVALVAAVGIVAVAHRHPERASTRPYAASVPAVVADPTPPTLPPHLVTSPAPPRVNRSHHRTPVAAPHAYGTWDRIASCESSGNWHDTDGIFDGGLQFTPTTWTEFGGRAYAATANLATRLEQITVAERVLAVQGWDAWPVCSRLIGVHP